MGCFRYEYMLGSEYAGMPSDQVPVRAIWVGLKEHTSAHGIPHIDQAKGTSEKHWTGIISINIGQDHNDDNFNASLYLLGSGH